MSVPLASAAGGGGVNREVLKGLQDVAWSDDEVSDGLSWDSTTAGKNWNSKAIGLKRRLRILRSCLLPSLHRANFFP